MFEIKPDLVYYNGEWVKAADFDVVVADIERLLAQVTAELDILQQSRKVAEQYLPIIANEYGFTGYDKVQEKTYLPLTSGWCENLCNHLRADRNAITADNAALVEALEAVVREHEVMKRSSPDPDEWETALRSLAHSIEQAALLLSQPHPGTALLE